MATPILKTVRDSGGNYTNLQAFIDARPADMIAADQHWIAEVYNDSIAGYVGETQIPNNNSSLLARTTIRAATANGTNGVSKATGVKGVGAKLVAGNNTSVIKVFDPNVDIEGLNLELVGDGGTRHCVKLDSGITNSAFKQTVKGCYMFTDSVGIATEVGVNMTYANRVGIDISGNAINLAGVGVDDQSGSSSSVYDVQNNTFANLANGILRDHTNHTLNLNNNAFRSVVVEIDVAADTATSNATSNAVIGNLEAGAIVNLADSNFTDAPNNDFTIVASSSLDTNDIGAFQPSAVVVPTVSRKVFNIRKAGKIINLVKGSKRLSCNPPIPPTQPNFSQMTLDFPDVLLGSSTTYDPVPLNTGADVDVWAVNNPPAGVTIDSGSGLLTLNYSAAGSYASISITGTNTASGLSDTTNLDSVTVTDPNTVLAPNVTGVFNVPDSVAGTVISVDLASLNTGGQAASWAFNGTQPPWLTIAGETASGTSVDGAWSGYSVIATNATAPPSESNTDSVTVIVSGGASTANPILIPTDMFPETDASNVGYAPFIIDDFSDTRVHDLSWFLDQPDGAHNIYLQPKGDSGGSAFSIDVGAGIGGTNALKITANAVMPDANNPSGWNLPGVFYTKMRHVGAPGAGSAQRIQDAQGYLNTTANHYNRLEFWVKWDAGFRAAYGALQPPKYPNHQNMHFGTYQHDPAKIPPVNTGHNGVIETDGMHFYHQIFFRHDLAGTDWIHVVLNENPSHIRSRSSELPNNPSGRYGKYWDLLTRFYIDCHKYFADPEIGNPASMWIDKIQLSYVKKEADIIMSFDGKTTGEEFNCTPGTTYNFPFTLTNRRNVPVTGRLVYAGDSQSKMNIVVSGGATITADMTFAAGETITGNFQLNATPGKFSSGKPYMEGFNFVNAQHKNQISTTGARSFSDANLEARWQAANGPEDAIISSAHVTAIIQ